MNVSKSKKFNALYKRFSPEPTEWKNTMIFQRLEASRKGPSQRQLRAGELVRKAISEILQQHDRWSRELGPISVTVTQVHMSVDLRYATICVMPLGGKQKEAVVQALAKASASFQRLLAGKVALKFVPMLRFKLDESIDHIERLQALFRQPKVQEDLRKTSDSTSSIE